MTDKDFHISEILAYACHYMHNSTLDNIKKVIESFYTEDEVNEGKRLLWDVSKDDLDPFVTRKKTNKRSCSSANIDDIFEALIKLDANEKLPKFVAYNISKIPDRQPEEFNLLFIIDRLNNVEKKIKLHMETLSNHAVDIIMLKENNEENKVDVKKGQIFDENNLTENTNIENNNEKNAHGGISNECLTTPGIVRKQIEIINQFSTNKHKYPSSNDEKEDDDFITVESKSARKRRLSYERRKRSAFELQGAPPPLRYVFLSRVINGNAKMIADYMKNKSIESNKVEMISHPKAKFKSFKITVSKDSLSFILSDNFWPNGIKCKIWRDKNDSVNETYNNYGKSFIHDDHKSRGKFTNTMNEKYNREYTNSNFSNFKY